jgi:hypothetical protein
MVGNGCVYEDFNKINPDLNVNPGERLFVDP